MYRRIDIFTGNNTLTSFGSAVDSQSTSSSSSRISDDTDTDEMLLLEVSRRVINSTKGPNCFCNDAESILLGELDFDSSSSTFEPKVEQRLHTSNTQFFFAGTTYTNPCVFLSFFFQSGSFNLSNKR